MEQKTTKEKYIHVRIEENFKNEVTTIAKENGLNLSTLVNMLLHKYYNEHKK